MAVGTTAAASTAAAAVAAVAAAATAVAAAAAAAATAAATAAADPLDPRLAFEGVSDEERRLARRLRIIFDAASGARGAAASGIPAVFASMAPCPVDACCALLDTVQYSLRDQSCMGAYVVRIILPHARAIVEALAASPDAATECLLAARGVPATKRWGVVERSAVECFEGSARILRAAEQAVNEAVLAGLPAGSMPDDSFWAIVNGHIDKRPCFGDLFAVNERNQVRHRITNAPIAPCRVWLRNSSKLDPRCCMCHLPIERACDVVMCRCLCATLCRACAHAKGTTIWHAGCDTMLRRADTLVHRLLGMPGSKFVCFAPSSCLLIPIPMGIALATPKLPVLWPQEMACEDVELLVGHPQLVAARLGKDDAASTAATASTASTASTAATAVATAVAAAAAVALAQAEVDERARAVRTAATASRKRARVRARDRRRRRAAEVIAAGVRGWLARRRQAAARQRALARDAQHAHERARIESRLVQCAVRADAAVEERIASDALLRAHRARRAVERNDRRLANPEVAMRRLAARMADAVLN